MPQPLFYCTRIIRGDTHGLHTQHKSTSVPVQAMKSYKSFLTSCHNCFTTEKKNLYALTRRLGGPQRRNGNFEEEKNSIFPCRGSNPGQSDVPTPTVTAKGGTKYIITVRRTLTFVKYEEF